MKHIARIAMIDLADQIDDCISESNALSEKLMLEMRMQRIFDRFLKSAPILH